MNAFWAFPNPCLRFARELSASASLSTVALRLYCRAEDSRIPRLVARPRRRMRSQQFEYRARRPAGSVRSGRNTCSYAGRSIASPAPTHAQRPRGEQFRQSHHTDSAHNVDRARVRIGCAPKVRWPSAGLRWRDAKTIGGVALQPPRERPRVRRALRKPCHPVRAAGAREQDRRRAHLLCGY
jgi:hypothetical protein